MNTVNNVRGDLLISACFADPPRNDRDVAALREFAQVLSAHWRYWEILIVCDTVSDADDLDELFDQITNLRLLRIRGPAQIYRRRVIAASEAIGDLVFVGAVEELSSLDVMAMLSDAESEDALVVGQRVSAHFLLDPLLSVIGRTGGFRVQSRDLQSTVYPRTLLNKLLARTDRQLAMRFPPHEAGTPVIYHLAQPRTGQVRPPGFGRRLGLIQKLLVNSAPTVLGFVSLMSILTAVFAMLFGIYAVGVWLFLENVQPGWFTTSLAISLTATFLGIAIFGLATGVLKLIDLTTPDVLDDVVDERGRADLFARVSRDLNIEAE